MNLFSPESLLALGNNNPFYIMWIFFVYGGWVIVVYGLVRLWWTMRLFKLQGRYLAKVEWVILAIDIPKASEQTPKAMEQVFATISGAHAEISKRDKYTKGEVQLSFSFEIVSIDGYIQFLVRTPKVFRDLVEGSIYAQYPDAEITEVEDYTKDIPNNYPNDKYKIWGAELQLAQNEAFPIRTYKFFEDQLSQELKDPISSLIENMSRIQKNEQVWFQIIVVPTENSEWVKRALKQAYKIAGKKVSEEKKSIFSPLLSFLFNLPNWVSFLRIEGSESKKDQLDFRVLNLTPGERSSVEAIETKASKLGFICKLRLIYVAPLEQYQTARVINSVFGAIKQFGDLTSNSLKPNKRTKTSVVWFFPDRRANERRGRIMRNYKARSWFLGSKYFILNAEELATIYHFPSIYVKNPYLKRTEAKKSDAPVSLPQNIALDASQPTVDLREQLTNLQLDNNYYESRYGKKSPPPAKPQNDHQSQKTLPATDQENATVPDNLPLG